MLACIGGQGKSEIESGQRRMHTFLAHMDVTWRGIRMKRRAEDAPILARHARVGVVWCGGEKLQVKARFEIRLHWRGTPPASVRKVQASSASLAAFTGRIQDHCMFSARGQSEHNEYKCATIRRIGKVIRDAADAYDDVSIFQGSKIGWLG